MDRVSEWEWANNKTRCDVVMPVHHKKNLMMIILNVESECRGRWTEAMGSSLTQGADVVLGKTENESSIRK